MDKLKMQSPNLVDANITKIAELFPNCITEDRDESGALRRVVDFDPLRAVFRDDAFASDSVKINVEQIFKLLSPGTEVKSI